MKPFKKRFKAVIVQISMSPQFRDTLDKWARATNNNRSEFIRQAVREYIDRLKKENNLK